MKTAIIIQARMTSTRLPGKVLMEVLNKPLLEIQMERLMKSKHADQIIVATTTNEDDQPIIKLCNKLGIECFRGPENDVLARYYLAAKKFMVDVIVRITSDCPLIDPVLVDKIIDYYKTNYPRYDYVSNCLERTYPRGMDTEVISYVALEKAFIEASAPTDREHVTTFIRMNPKHFRLANIRYQRDYSCHRWTVDTKEDFELIKLIIETIFPRTRLFTLEDCIKLIELHPEWSKINMHIKQKM